MSEANVSSEVSPTLSQPHSNPALAAIGRIEPTPSNPKGYPPYELAKVPGYTNSQIIYYLRGGQITDFAAFQKIKKSRDELLRSLGESGDSDGESITPPSRSTRSEARSIASPTHTRHTALSLLDAMDSEPDEIIPPLPLGGKGLKIDKITILRQGAGLLNYRTWLQEARTAFRADPYRFNTAENRVIFAALNMDNKMRELWAHAQVKQPQLASHWKKFKCWAEKSHLHGKADADKALQQFYEATQAENEDPVTFYSRLCSLAAAIEKDFDKDDFFPRLTSGLRMALTRNNRKGSNLEELLESAQEVWGTFVKPQRQKRPHSPENSTSKRQNQQSSHQNNQSNQGHRRDNRPPNPVSNEEQKRRFDNHLCFKCGEPNHLARHCKFQAQGSPTPKPPQAEPAKTQSAKQGDRRKKTRFQSATVQDEDNQSDSHSEEFSDDAEAEADRSSKN
jgi:hypothetical protein